MNQRISIRNTAGYSRGTSLYLKAANYVGETLAKVVAGVTEDTFERPGEEPQTKNVLMFSDQLDHGDNIVLNNTNTDTMCDAFGEFSDAWIGKKIWLGTKRYDIDGKQTYGWIITIPPKEEADIQY